MANESVFVIGRGVSGLAAERLALALGMKCRTASDADGDAGKIVFSGRELVVTSPGVKPESALLSRALASGCEVVGEMEFAFRHFPGKILAVTGTNGKTTATEMVAAFLSAAKVPVVAAGNIGFPLSAAAADVVEGRLSPATAAALEVSSFQLESIDRFSPFASVLLNVKSDHLDRYGFSLDAYRKVKEKIFNRVPPENRVYGLSMPEGDERRRVVLEDGVLRVDDLPCVRTEELAVKGFHNFENLAAALELVLRLTGKATLFSAPVLEAVKRFRTGRHRLEKVGEIDGVVYIDDSKATNPASVVAALQSFDRPVRLILGGLDKGMDFTELAGVFDRMKKVYLIGAAAPAIEKVLPETLSREHFGRDFAAAVARAKAEARPGETVLLSPACASMDMFRDYADRGEQFAALVKKGI